MGETSSIKSSVGNAISGAAAGAFSKSVVAPVERVKLLMQLRGSIQPSTLPAVPGPNHYQNAWDVALTVYREEGLLAFWRGNTPNVVRQAGGASLNFMFMDWYKNSINYVLERSSSPDSTSMIQRKKRLLASFLSGGLAGATATTFLYPFEFLRTRLAMDIGRTAELRQYPGGMEDIVMSTLRSDGISGLYQGYGVALAGVVLYRALHLGGYDVIKTELRIRKTEAAETQKLRLGMKNDNLSLVERFCAAQVVSVVAGTICYPIDSVRRRLMMQAGQPESVRIYQGALHCFAVVFQREGLVGFFRGLGPNLVRSVGGALVLVAFDVFRDMIPS